LITFVSALDISIELKNIFVFCCSTPLLPLSWIIGKNINGNIFVNEIYFDKDNKDTFQNKLLNTWHY